VSTAYRLLAPADLDPGLLALWRNTQAANDDLASPYFCPEFTQAVAAVRADARVVVIENQGRAAGFFPFQRSALGVGKPVGGPLSDYHGVIAAPQSDWDVRALMRAAGLSLWNFDHLVGDTQRFAPWIAASTISPQIDLREGYDRYVEARRAAGSDLVPKTEGLARKCARERGEIVFTWHEEKDDALEHLFRWKGEQYRRSGIPDGFAVPWTRALLRRICGTQGQPFAGICSTLRIGGRLAAVHVGMRHGALLHYWFPAYDAEFAKFSVGSILLLRIAAAASAHGVSLVDLGKGTDAYKERLMNRSVNLHEGCVEMPSVAALGRSMRRLAERSAAKSRAAASLLQLPLRALRRIERQRRFR